MRHLLFVALAAGACSRGEAERAFVIGGFEVPLGGAWKRAEDSRLEPGAVMLKRSEPQVIAIFNAFPPDTTIDPSDPVTCQEKARSMPGVAPAEGVILTFGEVVGCRIFHVDERRGINVSFTARNGDTGVLVSCVYKPTDPDPRASHAACEELFASLRPKA